MFPVTLTSFLLVFILGIPRFKELIPDGFGFVAVLFPLKSPVTSLNASGQVLFKYFACLPYLTLIGIFMINASMGVSPIFP